ncbi:MAG: oligosaccharide flippase family protein [Legionellaceae bacterium]|nr:oligosaccharide flippase family protein [Legionellaceae bacterium]
MNKESKFVFVLFTIAVTGYIVQYLLNIYLARNLSAAFYGEYSLAVKVLGIFISLVLFGTDTGAQCFLSRYLAANTQSTAEDYIAWNIKLVSMNLLLARALALILMVAMMGAHFIGLRDISSYPLIIFVLWVTPIAALFKLLSNFLLSTNVVLVSMCFSVIGVFALEFLLFYLFLSVFQMHVSFLTFGVVLCLSYVIIANLMLLYLRHNVITMLLLGIKNIFSTEIIKSEWFKRSSKLILNNILYLIISSMDIFIVKFFAANGAIVGYYGAVLTVSSLVWLVPNYLYQKLKPTISHALTSEAGKKELQLKLDRTNRTVFSIMTIIALGIIFFSAELLNMFGSDYMQGQSALIILTIGIWYAGTNQIAGVMLLYGGFEATVLKVVFLEIVLIVLCTIPATYWYGITGTAAATTLLLIVNGTIFAVLLRQKLGIKNRFVFRKLH